VQDDLFGTMVQQRNDFLSAAQGQS
jgi:hypothetical protein